VLDDDAGQGLAMGPDDYTVRQAVEEWLAEGLPGRAVKTVAKNKYCVEPLLVLIGSCLLRDLRADDVEEALGAMAMSYTTAAIRAGHSALTRSIGYASARSLVTSNVAKLVCHSDWAAWSGVEGIHGRASRPSVASFSEYAYACIYCAGYCRYPRRRGEVVAVGRRCP
jgi:hypothetical protein